LAERMVTHAWDNVFLHLVAAVVVDALGRETTYEMAARKLLEPGGVAKLREELKERGSLRSTYWICAFCINQHASICGDFGPAPPRTSREYAVWRRKAHDSAGDAHPLCDCRQEKIFNDRPVECELNKFDSMMSHLVGAVPGFKQVIAVDMHFNIFTRAWCVAELVEADSCSIPQSVLVHSQASLDQHYETLAYLDVRRCQASRPEDKAMILDKVSNADEFNERLQWLMFGTEGIFSTWVDADCRASQVGRICGRALSHSHNRHLRAQAWALDDSDSCEDEQIIAVPRVSSIKRMRLPT